MLTMKKFSVIGVMALLCAVACQREEVVTDNPTYNPKTKEVTAEFILSVSTNNANAETRMTAETVQATGTFRGMDKVHILTYALDYTGPDQEPFIWNNGSVEGGWPESAKATRDYDMARVFVKNEVKADQSSKVMEMSLPLQTNAVLIYGIAPKDKSSDEQGSVILSGDPVGKSVSNISYTLESRMSNRTAFDQFTDLMSRILTGILRSGLRQEVAGQGSMVTEDNRYKFWWPIDATSKTMSLKDAQGNYYADGTVDQTGNYTFHIGSQTWRDYAIAYDAYLADPSNPAKKMSAMEMSLGDMYKTITTIQTNGKLTTDPDYQVELRSGSAQSIFRLSEDVYSKLVQFENANITTWHDYVAALVAKNIHDRAYEFFYSDPATNKMVWRPLTGGAGIIEAVNNRVPDRTWETDYYLIEDEFFNRGTDQPGFPLNMGLPSGSALMKFLTVGGGNNIYEVVTYLKDIPAYGMGGASVSVDDYCYPAELMYWTNSSLRTTTESVTKDSYPTTVDNWDNSPWSGWTAKAAVKSTTRGVAVTKEINYGTALLKTHVKYGADAIHDNNKGIHPAEDDNVINVKTTSNQFKVTGLIIGGVDKEVGWDFLPIHNSFKYLVYDNLQIQGEDFYIPAAQATSSPVYTMIWDNYNSSLAVDAQSPVYIALELVNNTGKDLWGGLNLIRNEGTFYLVGKLDPTDATAVANLPKKNNVTDLSRANFNYPPFDAQGKTVTAPRVFMQDYVTEVTFTFNKHSMRNAYVTMPDLRASNISLGLSVDLNWTPGLVFTDVPLGGISSDEEY